MSRSVNSNAHTTRKSAFLQSLVVKGRAILSGVRIPNITLLTRADERASFPASLRLAAVPGQTTLTPNAVAGTLEIGAVPGAVFALANVGTGTGVADNPGVTGDLRSVNAAYGFTAPVAAQTITVTPPAPSTSGNVLTSNGTNWTSAALPAAVPTNATYVVQALSGGLSDERVLAATSGFSVADGGPNGNITLTPPVPSTSGNVMTSNGTNWTSAALPAAVPTNATYVVQALSGGLSDERVLAATSGFSFADGGANGPITLTPPAPSTSYNIMTSNGTNWTSATPIPRLFPDASFPAGAASHMSSGPPGTILSANTDVVLSAAGVSKQIFLWASMWGVMTSYDAFNMPADTLDMGVVLDQASYQYLQLGFVLSGLVTTTVTAAVRTVGLRLVDNTTKLITLPTFFNLRVPSIATTGHVHHLYTSDYITPVQFQQDASRRWQIEFFTSGLGVGESITLNQCEVHVFLVNAVLN